MAEVAEVAAAAKAAAMEEAVNAAKAEEAEALAMLLNVVEEEEVEEPPPPWAAAALHSARAEQNIPQHTELKGCKQACVQEDANDESKRCTRYRQCLRYVPLHPPLSTTAGPEATHAPMRD